MDGPLFWNTLEDAAAWLHQVTGENWTARKVIDTEIKRVQAQTRKNAPLLTNIKAVFPRDTTFGRYRFDRGGHIREGEADWDRPVPLALIHIQKLLVHGEARVGLVRSPDDDDGTEGQYIFIDPIEEEHIVNLKMAGIAERDLKSLLAFFESRKKKPQENQQEEKPLSITERDSMLKIMIGIAVKGYGYNPDEKKSKVIPEILRDLDELGVSVSDDTLRKYLKQAALKLPSRPS